MAVVTNYLQILLSGGAAAKIVTPPLDLGLAAFKADRYDEAVAHLEMALAAEAHLVKALDVLAKIHLAAARYDKARVALAKHLTIAPRNADLHALMGEALCGLKDLKGAEASFRLAVKHDRSYTDAHVRLGILLFDQKRFAEAKEVFDVAIHLDRKAVVARFYVAQICIELGDYQRALVQLHLVNRLQPDYPAVYLALATIFERIGDHRQAVMEFTRLVELGEADAEVHFRLAQAHLRLDDREKALRSFARAAELDATFWDAHYHGALLFEDHQRFAQALDCYRHLLVAASPYKDVAKTAIARITELLANIAHDLSKAA